MSNVQTQIDRINGEVSAQKALISQIATALEGKTAGGGGGLKRASGSCNPSGAKTFTITGLDFDPQMVVVCPPFDTTTSTLTMGVGTVMGAWWAMGYKVYNTAKFTHSQGTGVLTLPSNNYVTSDTYTWYAYGL